MKKLDPEAKAIVMTNDYSSAKTFQNSSRLNPSYLAHQFSSLNAAEKNVFIDQLQNQGLLTDFLQRTVGVIDQEFLNGVNKENVKFYAGHL